MQTQSWPYSFVQLMGGDINARPWVATFGPTIDRVLGLDSAEKMYTNVRSSAAFSSASDFVSRLHNEMEISSSFSSDALHRIPPAGPLIIVANHPFGGIEATVLFELISRVRKDVKFFANLFLDRLPETREACIYVDPFERSGAVSRNIGPMREAIRWVAAGGALCVFPAGTVSHFQWKRAGISDPSWSPLVGRIVRKTSASVVPVFFPGHNGLRFQVAGMVHPLLRTALLVREFNNKQGVRINVRIGKRITSEKLASFVTDQALIDFLRLKTYKLAQKTH